MPILSSVKMQLVGDDLRPVDDRNGLPVFGFIFPEFVFRKITVFVEPDRGVTFSALA